MGWYRMWEYLFFLRKAPTVCCDFFTELEVGPVNGSSKLRCRPISRFRSSPTRAALSESCIKTMALVDVTTPSWKESTILSVMTAVIPKSSPFTINILRDES